MQASPAGLHSDTPEATFPLFYVRSGIIGDALVVYGLVADGAVTAVPVRGSLASAQERSRVLPMKAPQ